MQVRNAETTFQMLRKGEPLPEDENLTGGDFPRFKLVEVGGFTPPVSSPAALLTGFDVEFEESESGAFEGEGRPLGHMDVRVAVEDVFDDTVTIRVTFGLRDWSGDWDDEHRGTVRFTVLAG